MKKVLLTTAPLESLIDPDGIGGNWYNKTDTYMAWTCALDLQSRLSVTCPPTGLHFLKANVPDVTMLEYPTWEEYRTALKSEQWDMVGISFYTWSTPVAIEMAKEAREQGVKDIWGGNYGAIGPGLDQHFTRLIKGQGEFELHQYVYGKPLQRIHHPPMLGQSGFRGIYAGVGYLYSKRGCNIGCHFCSTPVFNPKEDPIALQEMYEALDVYQQEKVAHVIIYDETFFLDNNIADLVVDALAERELPWICLTRADRIRGRVGELTDKYMDGAIIGVESFKDRNLKDVQKREDAWCVRETIRELNRYGRRALGTFMIGFPEDTPEDIMWDVNQLAQEDLFACQLTILTPFHGTKQWKKMEPLVSETDLNLFDLYHLVWDHPNIAKPEMRELLAWAQRTVNKPELIDVKIKKDLKEKLRKQILQRHPHINRTPVNANGN